MRGGSEAGNQPAANFIVSDQEDCFSGNQNFLGDCRFKMPANRLARAGLQGGINGQVDGFSTAAGRIAK